MYANSASLNAEWIYGPAKTGSIGSVPTCLTDLESIEPFRMPTNKAYQHKCLVDI